MLGGLFECQTQGSTVEFGRHWESLPVSNWKEWAYSIFWRQDVCGGSPVRDGTKMEET